MARLDFRMYMYACPDCSVLVGSGERSAPMCQDCGRVMLPPSEAVTEMRYREPWRENLDTSNGGTSWD
jgi:hypothetical protein